MKIYWLALASSILFYIYACSTTGTKEKKAETVWQGEPQDNKLKQLVQHPRAQKSVPAPQEATKQQSATVWEKAPTGKKADAQSHANNKMAAEGKGRQKQSAMGVSDAKIAQPSGHNFSKLGKGAGKVLGRLGPNSVSTEFKSAAGGAGMGAGYGGPPVARRPAKPKQEIASAPMALADSEAEWSDDGNNYTFMEENDYKFATNSPLSTFAVDVDTGSYSIMRNYLSHGQRPPKDSVRIEEYINYFDYNYAPPSDGQPFAVHMESANAPWQEGHRLLRIALKGREVSNSERKRANLVFLIDVSGSMSDANKLPLLKDSFRILLSNLSREDRVAMVVYAGASGLVLPSTRVAEESTILAALDRLNAGGSTNGGAGIQLAYDTARRNFIKGGNNRVILATDGDFNVGVTRSGDLVRMIQQEAKSNIFLTVLGFGMGNLQDGTLESLANKGNGTYAYIDSNKEARKVFSQQLTGTLETVAKDVKIQVEFNPEVVQAYRLIGYENRKLAAEDFNNDEKDAGEIGAGHSVTAIYEIVPTGFNFNVPGVDALKYQKPEKKSGWFDFLSSGKKMPEMATVKLRYKEPEGSKSKLITHTFTDNGQNFASASESFRFASAVAAFGMIMRDSKFKGSAGLHHVEKAIEQSFQHDPHGYKEEFRTLVRNAKGEVSSRQVSNGRYR